MELALLVPLVVLALLDSTSFGTLAIPVWFMSHPSRPKPARMLLYLGTIATFYFALGVGLYFGAQSLRDSFSQLSTSEPGRWIALIAGAVFLVLGLTIEPWTKEGKAKKRARAQKRRAERGPGRIERLRNAAVHDGSVGSLVVLALAAALIEAASMLPYLGAIGLLVAAELPIVGALGVLAGYCVAMVAPALVLLVLRIVLHDRIKPLLTRLNGWLQENAMEALAWVLALLGIWLITNNVHILSGPAFTGRLIG